MRRLAFVALLVAGPAAAASTEELRSARPDLFHTETGFRISEQAAETPDDIPGSRRVEAGEVRRMAEDGALLIDVGGAAEQRYDELDGSWPVNGDHMSIPGSTWLPEIGRGTLTEDMEAYLEENVERLTEGDRSRSIVVFCIADCWMSWNATQRLVTMGYTDVVWFADGSDGWTAAGGELAPIKPVPVTVD